MKPSVKDFFERFPMDTLTSIVSGDIGDDYYQPNDVNGIEQRQLLRSMLRQNPNLVELTLCCGLNKVSLERSTHSQPFELSDGSFSLMQFLESRGEVNEVKSVSLDSNDDEEDDEMARVILNKNGDSLQHIDLFAFDRMDEILGKLGADPFPNLRYVSVAYCSSNLWNGR